MESLQGRLLVAAPELRDPNFTQSVVLIVQHDDESALGLILNRPTSMTVRQVWEQVSSTPYESGSPIYWGGPVEGPLMALHTKVALSEIHVASQICYSVQSENLEALVAEGGTYLKFFLGFAGWGPGQLEAELAEGSWVTPPATFEHVFYTHDQLWANLIRESQSSILSALNIRRLPQDPSMN